ncbi:flagellar hook protein FlgE [Solimicrobium silvestre]|uniref:Flagellar hook protein FlgE n=1 Tax=Solimicrobium silvestre TaxID=2099400 RepID=A0A2S9GVS7_9BURK|nr:flagellar hook protein FlgE [Solimicrobium silvestre]PRC91827.1 Flagellar hook-basal body protein [Solimicrobium silvestre]
MAFDQGLSGLQAASTQLDVIGNNIANSSTVGFKESNIEFADVYANSLGGGGASAVGIGVSASDVSQQFTQGTISTDSNPLDIAIDGNGFFQVSTNGSIGYTRSGEFQLNENGAIVTSSGANLQGYNANANGVLNTGVTTNIVINSANLPPKITATVGTELNLNSSSPVLLSAGFDSTKPATYTYSTSVTVYDSLGNSHALQTYYVNNGIVAPSVEDQWSVFATVDGKPIGYTPPAAPVSVATLSFNSAGTLDPATTTPVTAPPFSVPLTIPLANGATTPQVVTISYTGTTQYGVSSGVNSQTQDGFASGQLTQFSAGADGVITGTYSNGQTQTLGQIVLDNFVNPSGLKSIGNNLWLASPTSGVPLLGTPGSGSLGTLQSDAVEDSTTDLTSELVNMITAQQDYQANAQTIKTEDQIIQTLVTLR